MRHLPVGNHDVWSPPKVSNYYTCYFCISVMLYYLFTYQFIHIGDEGIPGECELLVGRFQSWQIKSVRCFDSCRNDIRFATLQQGWNMWDCLCYISIISKCYELKIFHFTMTTNVFYLILLLLINLGLFKHLLSNCILNFSKVCNLLSGFG